MRHIVYKGNDNLVETLEKNGFFIVKNFFDRNIIIQLRQSLIQILEDDIIRRKQLHSTESTIKSNDGRSFLTEHMHDFLFPAFNCELYAELVDQMLKCPPIVDFTNQVIGENYRLRVDLFRQSTGIDDYMDNFELPHRWHRDTPGEFTFGFFLDDMEEHQCGGTIVIPGTHWSAYNPLWDLMFSPGKNYTNYSDYINNKMNYVYMPSFLNRFCFFNQLLKKKLSRQRKEIKGRMGDIYFFLNAIWHGRAPNRTGKKLMLSRIGGFSDKFAFKDDLPLPNPLFPLPDFLRSRYQIGPLNNHTHSNHPKTLLERMRDHHHDNRLTCRAVKEKQVFNRLLKKFHSIVKSNA